MDIRRHAASALVLASFLAFNTATSKSPSPSGSGSSPTPGATGSLSAPSDLNVSSLLSSLGCTSKPGNEGCRVLRDFDGADALGALPASGREVWYGESYALGGSAAGQKELFFLQIEPSGSGGHQGSARSLIPENPSEADDAAKVLAAVKRGDAAPRGSQAVDFMRTAAPPRGYSALKVSSGKSTALDEGSNTKVYLRRKGDRLLIIEHSGSLLTHSTGGTAAMAWCSELWRVK